MPSAKVLEQKQQQVTELKSHIEGSVAGVVVDYRGINVADDTKLRMDLREAGVYYAVVKNTLLRRAVAGTDLSDMEKFFTGTTAVAVSKEDHTAAARILSEFAKNSETFKIKGGFLEGKVVNADTVDSLAKLPSREVLLATVCNAFNAPIAAFARALQAVVDQQQAAVAE